VFGAVDSEALGGGDDGNGFSSMGGAHVVEAVVKGNLSGCGDPAGLEGIGFRLGRRGVGTRRAGAWGLREEVFVG